jgi:hypothetical protein
MGATERIKQYLDYKKISKYAFYKKTGFSNKFLDNSSNMGTDRAEIILRYYPDISPVWLLTGDGDMLLSETKKESEPIEQNPTLMELLEKKDQEIKQLNREIGRLQTLLELHQNTSMAAEPSTTTYHKKKV